jgi:serine/alanine adding enzyme
MLAQPQAPVIAGVETRVHAGEDLVRQVPRLAVFAGAGGPTPLSGRQPEWLGVMARTFRHTPYCLEAVEAGKTRGVLALAHVRSLLFGRFLVSLPYLNYGGVLADDELTARKLIDGAMKLADSLDVRYLELRHEQALEHPALVGGTSNKVHMRLALPRSAGELWDRLPAKVRNQARKGQKNGLTVTWGREELLPDFYDVFSRNMRDLGTPVYGRGLFRCILEQFADSSELCVVRLDSRAVAAALLLRGRGVTEVPSASSLRPYNHTCANMLLYWHLLERAVQRRQEVFDFGRSTPDSNTYCFKKQWGAVPHPAQWQYYLRQGSYSAMRPDNPKYQRWIRLWQRLPASLTRLIGPLIVRGIP